MEGLTFFIAISVASFIYGYEKKSIIVERAALIAILAAISSVGRIIFAVIPSIQPSSFVIIASGICFGSNVGMMTGLITALASNLLLGQGPWTIWQMFAWGLMGLSAGLLSRPLRAYKALRIAFGFLWGFLFGWIMNLWFVSHTTDIIYYFSVCIASFYFDFAHALSNALLFAFAGNMVIRRFGRIGEKYGIK